MRYIRDGRTRTVAQSYAQVEAFRATWTEHGLGLWALEGHDAPGCIGFCGLVPVRDGCVEIGWRLARAQWSRGLATETALAARDWAFELRGLDRLVAFCRPQNHASQRVMEKIGMTHAHDRVDDLGLPERVYELTRPEWEGVSGPRTPGRASP